MKVDLELILPDEGSSFRILHTKTKAENFPWQYHYHPEFELVCVLSGAGTRHVGHHMSNYSSGDLVLIGSNLPHAGFGLNAIGHHEEIVIQFKEEIFSDTINNRPELQTLSSLFEKSKYGISFHSATKEALTKKLCELVNKEPFEKFISVLTVLYNMAASTEYVLLNPDSSLLLLKQKNNARLQHILEYIEQHYKEDIDVKTAASIANLSVPSFCNYFKKLTNLTFTDFVNQFRIQRACSLLQRNIHSISNISYDCGFNSVAYFNKIFKEYTGKTPSQFKKDHTFVWKQ